MKKRSLWFVLLVGIIALGLSGCVCGPQKVADEAPPPPPPAAVIRQAPPPQPAVVQPAPPPKKDRN